MANGTKDLLSRGDYFSPTPILAYDDRGRVVDVNLAFEILLGDVALGCRAHPVEDLLRVLGNRIDGHFIPRELSASHGANGKPWKASHIKNGHRTEMVTVHTADYGRLKLLGTAIPRCDESSGLKTGTTCYWEAFEWPGFDGFRARFVKQLEHELNWEMYAVSYDRILPEMAYYQTVLRRHSKAFADPAFRDVADMGTGTGNLAELLLRQGKRVVAIDNSRAMLARLRSKPWASTNRLVIFQQSAEQLSNLHDDSCDGVNILLALYNMQKPRDALQEAIRILRPGGRIVITEPKRSIDLKVILGHGDRRLRRIRKYDALAADKKRVDDINDRFKPKRRRSSLFIEDIWDALTKRGFARMMMKDSHFHQCATIIGTKSAR